jgi:molybdate transport system substrate-binding protein
MQAVIDAGRIAPDAPQIFARNRLVVILPLENPAGLAALPDLARPGIKLVLAATEVPVGGYSLAFLDNAAAAFGPDYRDRVLANVVSYEENVRAVVSKVALGEADAGIVYATDIAGDAADQVARIAIPDALNVVAEYPLAVLADAVHPDLAQALAAYVLSPEGQAILTEHGFLPAP